MELYTSKSKLKGLSKYDLCEKGVAYINLTKGEYKMNPLLEGTINSIFDEIKQPTYIEVSRGIIHSQRVTDCYNYKVGRYSEGCEVHGNYFQASLTIGMSDAKGYDQEKVIFNKFSTKFDDVLMSANEINTAIRKKFGKLAQKRVDETQMSFINDIVWGITVGLTEMRKYVTVNAKLSNSEYIKVIADYLTKWNKLIQPAMVWMDELSDAERSVFTDLLSTTDYKTYLQSKLI